MSTATSPKTHELTITRRFNAPRTLVFRCWTDPAHLDRWEAAPEGFHVTKETVDVRPGGHSIVCMHAPDGAEHWLRIDYVEVTEPERLVFDHAWLDEARKRSNITRVTITFAEVDGATELTLHQAGLPSEASADGHREGWTSALRRLSTYLDTAA